MPRPYTLKIMLLAAAFASPGAFAQEEAAGPVAVVTIVTGSGATRGAGGPSFREDDGRFSADGSALNLGDSVVTAPDGAAVITFPGRGMSVHLRPSSELKIEAAPGAGQTPFALYLSKGEAYIARKASEDKWLAVAVPGQGYTLSKGASLAVVADAADARFTATQGSAVYFAGPTPGGALVDAAGQPVDKSGVPLGEGQQISSGQPASQADAESGRTASANMRASVYEFGLAMSDNWVEDAEQGDLVPVRGETRAAVEAFADAGRVSEQTFDQPRAVLTAPTPRTTRPATQVVTVANPVLALRQSRIPSEVVVGQRFARTRIIGNPGTSGGGQIRVNPFAEQLIRLPGNRGTSGTRVPSNSNPQN